MAESAEIITIEKCPRCESSHRYRLAVQRSWVLKRLTAADMRERARPVKVTRLFTCPVTNDDYQASLVLYDTSSSRIEHIGNVLGLAKDDDSD
jgi:hypothetical protein